jgi:hypothetical protein
MPLVLNREEQDHLLALAAPLPNDRRPEFWAAVTTKLEAAGPAAIGIGTVHRTALAILGDGFWSPPRDLRVGRLGGRTHRS